MEADYGDVVPRRDYERLKERFQALEKDLKKVRKDQEALMKEHRLVDLLHSTRGKVNFYRAKNYHLFKVDENRIKQCCAVHIVHKLSKILFSIVKPDYSKKTSDFRQSVD